MSVDERVADALLGQVRVDAGEVAALRKPDALGAPAERRPVVLGGDADLRADGGRDAPASAGGIRASPRRS